MSYTSHWASNETRTTASNWTNACALVSGSEGVTPGSHSSAVSLSRPASGVGDASYPTSCYSLERHDLGHCLGGLDVKYAAEIGEHGIRILEMNWVMVYLGGRQLRVTLPDISSGSLNSTLRTSLSSSSVGVPARYLQAGGELLFEVFQDVISHIRVLLVRGWSHATRHSAPNVPYAVALSFELDWQSALLIASHLLRSVCCSPPWRSPQILLLPGCVCRYAMRDSCVLLAAHIVLLTLILRRPFSNVSIARYRGACPATPISSLAKERVGQIPSASAISFFAFLVISAVFALQRETFSEKADNCALGSDCI